MCDGIYFKVPHPQDDQFDIEDIPSSERERVEFRKYVQEKLCLCEWNDQLFLL